MTLKGEEKADQIGNYDLNKKFSGFSFCFIYPRLGPGEASNWQVPMGTTTKEGTTKVCQKEKERGSLAKQKKNSQ